jgi:Cu(I)/Ag(I) efflux system membrane fusion protein
MTRLLLLLLLGSIAVLTGCDTPDVPAESGLYTCGMHPQVIQEGPGTCPICGMDLTPMGAGSVQADEIVEITPGVVQQIGVETAPVQRTTVFRHIRTIGEVEVGEDELAVVNLRFSGWVERILVDKTGDEVTAGQTLFEIYSPELVAAQEEYLLALRTQGADSALARSARRKLELWNLGSRDIDRIATAGVSSRTMPIRAPQSGFVLHKDLVEGARVSAGQDLYRIGNLQRIWVTAEVYEHDAPWVEEGQPAQLEMTHLAGQVIEGQVSYIYPTMNRSSRTLTVRLEFDNPGVRLKPGMFATVHIQYRRQDDVLAVPAEAILHSGRRQLVFVALGQGRFEPREVTTGLTGDHHMIEITGGLSVGEQIVTSGQFLIDSESQLQEALRKILISSQGLPAAPPEPDHTVWSCPMHPEVLSEAEGRCPECGMFLEERPGTPEELEKLHGPQGAQPGQYTCPMHPQVISDEPGRCPICDMFLEQVPSPAEADAPAGSH